MYINFIYHGFIISITLPKQLTSPWSYFVILCSCSFPRRKPVLFPSQTLSGVIQGIWAKEREMTEKTKGQIETRSRKWKEWVTTSLRFCVEPLSACWICVICRQYTYAPWPLSINENDGDNCWIYIERLNGNESIAKI